MASIITQISSGFESLNDDTHGLILEFVGKKSYYAYGAIDKRCNQIYLSKNLPKETFLHGYAPLAVIKEKCVGGLGWSFSLSVGYGVLYYNRRDVLEWALLKQEEHPYILNQIFNTAVEVGRLDILNEIYDRSAEDVLYLEYHILSLEWLIDNGCSFKERTFRIAAEGGHLCVLEWLRNNNCPWDKLCYICAAKGGHIHVLDWLRDNECPRGDAELELYEQDLRNDVKVWLRNNGFSMLQYIDSEDEYEDEY